MASKDVRNSQVRIKSSRTCFAFPAQQDVKNRRGAAAAVGPVDYSMTSRILRNPITLAYCRSVPVVTDPILIPSM